MSQEQHRFPVVVSIKCKKLAFDEAKFGTRDPEDVVVVKKCERRELHMGQHRTGTDSEDEFIAYCYWYPKLFGVDEVGSSNLTALLLALTLTTHRPVFLPSEVSRHMAVITLTVNGHSEASHVLIL